MSARPRRGAGRILREPLVHFLVLGALVFAGDRVLHPPAGADSHRIEIGKADVERIRALYAQQWGAPPGAADMPNLLKNYIRSEILYREGRSLGLAADDSVVRNRVTQKMEFLLQDSTPVAQPSEAEMATYLDRHRAAYRIPETVVFDQIYFSPSLRGARAEADAEALLISLRAGPAPQDPTADGDPLMLGDDPAPRSQAELEADYGQGFARALFRLPTGSWQGPVRSVLGLHLVRILEHRPARDPALAEVRDRVHDDLMVERFRQANDSAYAKIAARYRIVVAPDALGGRAAAVATANAR